VKRERLDKLLVERGALGSRERARRLIMAGAVRVDDRVVGTITTAAGDAALAFIRREVTPGAEVIAGLTTARVEAVF